MIGVRQVQHCIEIGLAVAVQRHPRAERRRKVLDQAGPVADLAPQDVDAPAACAVGSRHEGQRLDVEVDG
ncbi:hypothetical protein D9K51_25355 [Escherichia coli]|nr:hypothetical protein [Salmonella enterica subsp. enterica]OZP64947.1 hypothetical protein CIG53_27640 [Enterobacter asburiae]PQH17155.1 hypothetical protein C5T93_29125 [Raoultella ornithinolytica]RXP13047.1 hypothetical protein D9K51_25355 [Escherichia coli]HAV4990542.1 hypothetical protein [Acinetobacter nosocomialis]